MAQGLNRHSLKTAVPLAPDSDNPRQRSADCQLGGQLAGTGSSACSQPEGELLDGVEAFVGNIYGLQAGQRYHRQAACARVVGCQHSTA